MQQCSSFEIVYLYKTGIHSFTEWVSLPWSTSSNFPFYIFILDIPTNKPAYLHLRQFSFPNHLPCIQNSICAFICIFGIPMLAQDFSPPAHIVTDIYEITTIFSNHLTGFTVIRFNSRESFWLNCFNVCHLEITNYFICIHYTSRWNRVVERHGLLWIVTNTLSVLLLVA